MLDRAPDRAPRQPQTAAPRPWAPARAAARRACPTRALGGGRARRGPAARAGRDRSCAAGWRAASGLPARALGRAGPWRRHGLCRGAARSADGRSGPCGLDRSSRRSVRARPGRARPCAGTADRGPSTREGCPPLGARGGLAQPRARRRPGRDRPPHPDPEPSPAARRRSQGGERLSAPAAARWRAGRRGRDPLADRRCGQPGRGAARPWPASLAGRAGPLPWWPERRLADRMARGRLA
jgi:hypothetical protein